MTDPRDIPIRDIDWWTLMADMGRSVRPLWRLSLDPPRPYPDGSWHDLTLGEVADLGEQAILRLTGVGPEALQRLREIIDMARTGTLPLKGAPAPAPDSLWPRDREENGRFSGGSGDYYEGIEEGCKAGSKQERRIWRMAIERYFDGAAVEDVERYVEKIRQDEGGR